jgi:hypothetical protein
MCVILLITKEQAYPPRGPLGPGGPWGPISPGRPGKKQTYVQFYGREKIIMEICGVYGGDNYDDDDDVVILPDFGAV